MLQVSDVRQTRVFQEAQEEMRKEMNEKIVLGLLKVERPIKEIVQVTGLTPAQIRKIKKKHQSD